MNYAQGPTYGQYGSQPPVQYVVVNNPQNNGCRKCGGTGWRIKKGRQKPCKKCNRLRYRTKTRFCCFWL